MMHCWQAIAVLQLRGDICLGVTESYSKLLYVAFHMVELGNDFSPQGIGANQLIAALPSTAPHHLHI
jgi:hypothetical protein